jgi:hypothetical protein
MNVKKKISKSLPVHALEVYGGNRRLTPLILSLDIRLRSQPLYPPDKRHDTNLIWDCVGLCGTQNLFLPVGEE